MNKIRATASTVAKLTAITSQPWRMHRDWRNSCRFCKHDGSERPLWKYGVRHYCCEDCRKQIVGQQPTPCQQQQGKAPTPLETPEYWLRLARSERAAAAEDRARRYGTVESIRIHEQNAAEYEARAAALAAKGGA